MYTVTGLVPDAEYQFRVIAQNDIGESEPGPASEPVVCKDPFGKYLSIHFQIIGQQDGTLWVGKF